MSPIMLGDRDSIERKLGDAYLARWETEDLPEGAVVTHVTFVPFRGDRLPLPWHEGTLTFLEGEVREGETGTQAIERIGMEMAGIKDLEATHLGHLRCRATSYNPTQPLDTITYRALYGVEVGELADEPTLPGYERRMSRERDLMAVIHQRYANMDREYGAALNTYYTERLKKRQAAEAGA